MELAWKLLSVLALCGLAPALDVGSTPATPCSENGCPNITLYMGPRFGSKVLYLGTEPGNTTGNATKQAIPTTPPITHFTIPTTPPITHFTIPPTPRNVPNSEETTSGNPQDDTEAKTTLLTPVEEKVEIQLSDVLATPDPEEGIEEFDLFEPKPTSIYDVDSESEESFDEFDERQIQKLRKPVPVDGSFSIEFEQPKDDEEGAVRILPNSPDFLGGLDWSGYQLTGKQVKGALYTLTPYARRRLRSLDISSNLIRDLEPLTFPPELEDTLEQLLLDGNPVQYLSSSSRFELSRLQRLKVLSLSHTSLRSFPPLLLPSLETLYLQGNSLAEVPDTLSSIPSLVELDLSENFISRIDEPIDLAHLRIIKLNNNSIDRIDKDAFRNCFSLQEVYLYQNRLLSHPDEAITESRAWFYLDATHRDLAILKDYFGKPPCSSCPGLPSWVYSFTLNSSLLLVSLLVLLLAVVAIRTRLTRLPPYTVLREKSPV